MSEHSPAKAGCPRCSYPISAMQRYCVKCGLDQQSRQISDDEPLEVTEIIEDASLPLPGSIAGFSLSSMLMVVTLVAICLGLSVANPGLGIAAAVISLPPLLRTVLVARKQRQQGVHLSPAKKTRLFASSWLVTTLMSMTVSLIISGVGVVALLLSVVVICSAIPGGSSSQSIKEAGLQSVWIVTAVFGLTVVFFTLRSFWFWSKTRWKRDIGDLNSDS